MNIYKTIKTVTPKNYGIYSDELANKLVTDTYEELYENISDNDLERVNNLFRVLCGVSLDTLICSEDETLPKGYYEPIVKIEETKAEDFLTDLDKVDDLLHFLIRNDKEVAVKEFLKSYSYMTEDEVLATIDKLNIETLADLFRQAENIYIEELNNRPTVWNISSADLKCNVVAYLYKNFNKQEQDEFDELIQSMGC